MGDNALTVYYKTSDGKYMERILSRNDEAKPSVAKAGSLWAFDAPGKEFKLAVEACRITGIPTVSMASFATARRTVAEVVCKGIEAGRH